VPNTRRLSDANLVRRSQQGDRRAFGALLGRYDRRLRGLAHVLILDTADMDTALGVAYLRAWRDVVRITPKDDIGAWLYRATYNACIDQLRRDGRPAPRRYRGVRRGLAGLAPLDRVAVVLVDREEFSPGAAARILGMTPAVLEERLAVARAALAEYLPRPAVEPAPAAAAAPARGNGAQGNEANGNGNGSPPAATAAPAEGEAAPAPVPTEAPSAGPGPGATAAAGAAVAPPDAAPEAAVPLFPDGSADSPSTGVDAAVPAPREDEPAGPPAAAPASAPSGNGNGSASSRRRNRRRRGGKHSPGQAAATAPPVSDATADDAGADGARAGNDGADDADDASADSDDAGSDGAAEDRDPTAETPVPGSPS
jgi:RNA polymerase sigma-70 factor, ECF subfamily